MRPFPAAFRFGVATADHQCEAYDGRDDIRDVWEREERLTPRGRATDFWNRYREDIDLAKSLGCGMFRLSLSWARLEPAPSVWSDEAFDHYASLLQYLRDRGMQSVVTLHHNTWPLHVQAAGGNGGLLDPGFPDIFARYAETVARRLGDRIDYYVTINEPNQLLYGFVKPWFMRSYPMPPGLGPDASSEEQMEALLALIPNLFLAHARGRAAIHRVRPGAMVGTNPLVFGFPRWLQRWVDRSATRLRNPDDLRAQAKHLSQSAILDVGRVDVSIAQIVPAQACLEPVLFSRPYANGYAAAVALGNHTLLNAVNEAIRSERGESPATRELRRLDRSAHAIRRRGVLRAGIRPGVPGLCTRNGGSYDGIEPDIARRVAQRLLGEDRVEFVELEGDDRVNATRSWLHRFDGLRKTITMFATIIGTDWWNLGLAGSLAPFLCPSECVGALDYVGLDYYWGVPSLRPSQLERLFAAAECRYGSAPVWPNILYDILREEHERFAGKRIVVIENGCVASADRVTRAQYVARHIASVQRAVNDGIPVDAYICWSITSNREWGLPFDDNSDFGLYHIDLDTDPDLTRRPTPASERYGRIIAARTAYPEGS
jgi:beta-glucosidase/6-phospho-beta-glucosidase/beta-galactosidase